MLRQRIVEDVVAASEIDISCSKESIHRWTKGARREPLEGTDLSRAKVSGSKNFVSDSTAIANSNHKSTRTAKASDPSILPFKTSRIYMPPIRRAKSHGVRQTRAEQPRMGPSLAELLSSRGSRPQKRSLPRRLSRNGQPKVHLRSSRNRR